MIIFEYEIRGLLFKNHFVVDLNQLILKPFSVKGDRFSFQLTDVIFFIDRG